MTVHWEGGFDAAGISARIEQAALAAVQEAADMVLAKSAPLVPTESGALRDSGETSSEDRGGVATAAVAYGTRHAVRVHEDLDDHHDDGQAKFLEQPLTESGPEVAAAAAARIRKALS